MAKKERSYILSQPAKVDLEELFDQTKAEFGIKQAVNYTTSFEELFNLLSKNPELGRTRDDIRKGLRSMLNQSHLIFYRVMKQKRIRIIRILHGNRDLPKQFR